MIQGSRNAIFVCRSVFKVRIRVILVGSGLVVGSGSIILDMGGCFFAVDSWELASDEVEFGPAGELVEEVE